MLVEPEDAQLLDALARLAEKPPKPLVGRLVAASAQIEGPAGTCFVAFSDEGIAYIELAAAVGGDRDRFAERFRDRFSRPIRPMETPPPSIARALLEPAPKDLRIDLSSLTSFERAVLDKTSEIPRGEIRPYAWVAAEIGRPKAVRAVGSALGRNPVPFLIPCHRVVRSDGSIGNYGFGPSVKVGLLRGEGIALDERREAREAGPRFVASTTSRVVCYPSCRHARRIGAANRIAFTSLLDAVGRGYRPCRRCRPVPGPTG